MKKRIKIAAGLIAAMTLVTTITGISASAASYASRSDTAYGTLIGEITTGADGLTQKWTNFRTSTTNTAYKLIMSADIDSYPSGTYLTGFSNYYDYYTTEITKKIYLNAYAGTRVSAFGAHEARTSSSSSWGVYTSISEIYA